MNDKKKFSFKPVCSSGEGITHVSAKERGLADAKLTTQNHFLFRYLHTSHLYLFVCCCSVCSFVFSLFLCFAIFSPQGTHLGAAFC